MNLRLKVYIAVAIPLIITTVCITLILTATGLLLAPLQTITVLGVVIVAGLVATLGESIIKDINKRRT